MAAIQSNGEMQFWSNGLPYSGINKPGNLSGEMQYWFNGLPFAYIFPSGPINMKTWDGLAETSIKTINGLEISNVKSINGLT